jgi:hypothetical protein
MGGERHRDAFPDPTFCTIRVNVDGCRVLGDLAIS